MFSIRVALTIAAFAMAAHVPELKFGPTYEAAEADPRLGALRTLDGHFPFTPSASKEAWQARATALRRQVRVSLGLWPWPTRTPLNAVVHGAVAREGYTVERVFFESVPGHFVTGSLYRPTGGRQAARGALAPRPLARRTLPGHRRGRAAQATGLGRRAIRQRGAAHPAGARRAAGAHGRGRLPVRHGRVRRQRADPAGHRAQPTRADASGFRRRAVLQRGRRTPPSIDSRPPDVERRPRAGFPGGPARCRSGAHRGHRRQRRRHADVPSWRDRRSARGGLSGRHGLGAHAGRVHMRERGLPARGHRQRGAGGAVCAQAAGHDRSRRLDRDDADRRVSGVAETLRPVWRSRQGAVLSVPPVRPQLQPREPRGDVRLAQPPPGPRRRRARPRARLRAAHARRGDGLDAGASRAHWRRGARARGDRVVDGGHRPTTSTDAAA